MWLQCSSFSHSDTRGLMVLLTGTCCVREGREEIAYAASPPLPSLIASVTLLVPDKSMMTASSVLQTSYIIITIILLLPPALQIKEAVDFFQVRFNMHQSVYTHKVVKAVEYMVRLSLNGRPSCCCCLSVCVSALRESPSGSDQQLPCVNFNINATPLSSRDTPYTSVPHLNLSSLLSCYCPFPPSPNPCVPPLISLSLDPAH